jgi:hypothetical protein
MHAYRVYGQPAMLRMPESESIILKTVHKQLTALQSLAKKEIPMLPVAALWQRAPPLKHGGFRSVLYAEALDSHFPQAHDTYNAISVASDGRYILPRQ